MGALLCDFCALLCDFCALLCDLNPETRTVTELRLVPQYPNTQLKGIGVGGTELPPTPCRIQNIRRTANLARFVTRGLTMDVEPGLMNGGERWRAIPDQSCRLRASRVMVMRGVRFRVASVHFCALLCDSIP